MNVYYRNCKNGSGLKQDNGFPYHDDSTAFDLKYYVWNKLKPYPYADGIEVTIDNLRLFQIEDDDVKPIATKDDTFLLDNDSTYAVYEYFTKLPVDMYQSVILHHLVDAVYTVKDNQWTDLSPIYCGSFKDEEDQKSFTVSKKNIPIANGVSLRCGDDIKHWDDGNPFEPSTTKNQIGEFCISLEEMYGLLPAGERNIKQGAFPELGITFSSLTHRVLLGSSNKLVMPKFNRSQLKEGKYKKHFFYRYKLAKGTDLEPFQMAIVLDNKSEHLCCTLIIDREEDVEVEVWQNVGPGSHGILWPPGEDIPDEKDDRIFAWKRFVNKKHVLPRKTLRLYWSMCYEIYPIVAAHFELHDLKIVTSKEPVPPPDSAGDKEKDDPMYLGAIFLYNSGCHIHPEEWILALHELETNGYDATKLSNSNLDTLLDALDDVMSEGMGNDGFKEFYCFDFVDEDTMDPVEILKHATSILDQIRIERGMN
jgi:hypothetical protein